jgi:hypothetical protein
MAEGGQTITASPSSVITTLHPTDHRRPVWKPTNYVPKVCAVSLLTKVENLGKLKGW